MLKTLMLAAFAAVAMAATAQDYSYGRGPYDQDKFYTDTATPTMWDMHKAVIRQDCELQGADKYAFETLLNRLPANTENALVKGLWSARKQSVQVYDAMCAAAIPVDNSGFPTTTDVIASVNTDDSARPMKMIMQAPRPHDIDYNTALDILCSNLNATEATQVTDWFNGANDREKDVVIKLLKHDAMKADDPIYASCLVHRTYDVKMPW